MFGFLVWAKIAVLQTSNANNKVFNFIFYFFN